LIADTIINDPDVYEAATKDDKVKQADDASAKPSAFDDLTVTSESPAKRPRIGDDDAVTPTQTAHVTQVSPPTASSTRPSSSPVGGEYAALIQTLQSENCALTAELDMQLDRFLTKAIKLKQNQTGDSIVFSFKDYGNGQIQTYVKPSKNSSDKAFTRYSKWIDYVFEINGKGDKMKRSAKPCAKYIKKH